MQKRSILFIGFLSLCALAFFIHPAATLAAPPACTLPGMANPEYGDVTHSFSYHIGGIDEGDYVVSGSMDFGDGTSQGIPGEWKQANGSIPHTFPGPGQYTITLECDNAVGFSTISKDYIVSGGGFVHNECQNNSCAEVSGAGANQCSTPGTPCGGNGSPTAIDVTISSNLNTSWTVGPCPSNPAATTNCPLSGSGQNAFYSGLAGSGDITISVPSIAGKTVWINGVEGQSNTITVPENRNNTEHVVWTIYYGSAAPSGNVTVTTPSCVAPGGSVAIGWNNATGVSAPRDWLALVPKGAQWNGNYPWSYWNGSQTAPTQSAPSTGNGSLVAPPGQTLMQAIYYRDDGFTIGGRSADIEVRADCGCTGPNCGTTATLACRSVSPAGPWSAGPCSVPAGTNVELQWSSAGANTCTATGDWTGVRNTSGTELQGPVSRPMSYSLECTAGGATSGVQTVTALPSSVSGPSVDLTCRRTGSGAGYTDGPCVIASGDSLDLSWTSTSTTACTGSIQGTLKGNTWNGAKAVSGSSVQGPIGSTVTFELSCTTTDGGTVFDSVLAQIGTPPPSGATVTPNLGGQSCAASAYTATIAWTGLPDPSFGFRVDVSADSSFVAPSTKTVPGGAGSSYSTDTSGFSPALSLQPNITYYVRISNGSYGPTVSFTVPLCVHMACFQNACVPVPGVGSSTCSQNSECITDSHLTCVRQTCTRVDGAGTDACKTEGGACSGHTVCDAGACVLIPGPGPADQCSSSVDCPGITTHLECRNSSCVSVAGKGENLCTSNASCTGHTICSAGSCVNIAGPGPDQCVTSKNCDNLNTYTTCEAGACVLKQGTLPNRCEGDADCGAVSHTVCRNNACMRVSGTGDSQCDDTKFDGGDSDCGKSHTVCDGAACKVIPGAGENMCDGDAFCASQNQLCEFFTATPNRLVTPPLKATTLSWKCSGVTSCSIDHGVGAVGAEGSKNTTPVATTVYTLSCTGPKGESSIQSRLSVLVRVFELVGGALKEILPK